MNVKCPRFPVVIIAVLALALGAGCGDDELDGNDGDPNDGPNQNQSQDTNQNQKNNGEEDCEDDETYNPITGECVEDEDNGESPTESCEDVECDPGMHCESSSGECVECISDGHCDGDDVCEDNECVDPDPAPECSSDDDCDDDQECNTDEGECEEIIDPDECGPGGITGETCTADDGVLPGADVVVEGYDCDGVPFTIEETAGNDGAYEFTDVPSGTHELTITSGSFEVSDEVTVQKGEITDRKSVGQKLCFIGTEVDIAVADGSFDNIGEILDNMNIEYDDISNNSSFFSDLDEMKQYDIIFAECGTNEMGLGGGGFGNDVDDIAYNIRRYVETGHSLYASDWASSFVRYTIPEAATFADSTGGSQDATAEVVSDDMQMLLESDTADINFNLGGWHIMEEAGLATDVQFRGDVNEMDDIPFMIVYDDPIGNGRAIYTSFHNQSQATGDMEDILEFMIFQL